MRETTTEIDASAATYDILSAATSRHSKRISETHAKRTHDLLAAADRLDGALRQSQADGKLAAEWSDYLRDAGQRATLTLNTLRKRGDIFLDHEEAGCPPVLVYDYEIIMDGKDLPYPSNYVLLKIIPPAGLTIVERKRPYVIIDPAPVMGPASAASRPTARLASRCRTDTRSISWPSAASRSRGSSCPM